jgi:phenylalanyl-tRNA synthetase beta chain
MVVFDISHKELNQALGKTIKINELEEVLFDMGFELASIQEDLLTIEITAERLDVLSLQGLARAIKSFKEWEKPKVEFQINKKDYVVYVTKKVKDIRPYTVCAIIKNLKLDDSKIKQIINVQEKLHSLLARGRTKGAIGIYPLDTIKLPITYTASKPEEIKFIPLGSDKMMHGLEILSDHPTGKEYAHLLKGKEMFPYFIDAKGEILSMPPIINSEKTGRVTEKTKQLFIECSGFDKVLLNEMLTNIVTMFDQMGGEIYEVEVKYELGEKEKLPLVSSREMFVYKKTIYNLMGIQLDDETLKKLLEKMMYEVVKITKEQIVIKAPCFRRDLWHQIDVADDIARAYGYNNLKLELPQISTIGATLPLSDLKEELSQVMVGLNFLETYTNTLVSKTDHIEKMNLTNSNPITVINGTENQTMMRLSILPELLNSIMHNRSNTLPQKIFEAGLVVIPDQTKDVKCRTDLNLSALIADKEVSFTNLKQTLDFLLKTKGLKCEIIPTTHESFIKGRVGKIILNQKEIGLIGELHPQVLINFGLITPIVVFEINLNLLVN